MILMKSWNMVLIGEHTVEQTSVTCILPSALSLRHLINITDFTGTATTLMPSFLQQVKPPVKSASYTIRLQ